MRAARLVTLVLAVFASLVGAAWALPSYVVLEPLGVPRKPVDIAVGDLNKDGIDDIAIASRGTNKVSIVLVQPDGSFRQGASVVVGNQLKAIAIGDFNGDDKGDLVISTGTRNIFIFPGNGDGTFGSKTTIRRCCSGAGVTTGDFNNSRPGATFPDDIAVADPSNDDVNVLFNRNQSNNGLSFLTPGIRIQAGNKPVVVVTGDFDNDGRTDIGAINEAGTGNDTSSILNTGAGSFSRIGNFFSGKRARGLSLGDYNKDTFIDFVAADQRSSSVFLLPGLGGGLFGTGPIVPIPCVIDQGTGTATCSLRQALIEDVDGDGNPDLVALISGPVSNSSASGQTGGDVNAVLVYASDSGGNFTGPTRFPNVGLSSRLMKVGNFNGDDKPDLVVASLLDSKIRLLLNNSGSVANETNTPTATTPTPTRTQTPGGTPPSPTPTQCHGQGCGCDPVNGDSDCNEPYFCAENDELCCDTPCDVPNVSCSLPGFEGTCKPTDLEDGTDCSVGDECGSGFCVDQVCCQSACNGANEHCDAIPGQCTSGSPRPTASATATSPTGNQTPTATIRLKELGEDCSGGSECRSSFCPSDDLVCCNSACNGANQRCDLPTQPGQCLSINLTIGQLCVVDGQCVSNVCEGGQCSGAATRTPTPPGGSRTPTVAKRTGDECTSNSECDSGNCPPLSGVCCSTVCDGANERCDLIAGTCLSTDFPDGSDCQFPQQCQSQICDGGVCQPSDVPPTRTPPKPTATRTMTPIQSQLLTLARGSGCSAGDGDGGLGSMALLLAFPAWWRIKPRIKASARGRRLLRRG